MGNMSRLRVERLDLRLLVHAQDDGMLGRADVEADHIAHLGHEIWIGRELERLHAMGLQTKGTPDALHARDHGPLSFAMPRELQWVILWKAFQGFYDGGVDALIIDPPGAPGSWLVAQTLQAVLFKAAPPLTDRHLDHTELRRDLLILAAFRTGLNDPGPQR